jgi:hypothetical protein
MTARPRLGTLVRVIPAGLLVGNLTPSGRTEPGSTGWVEELGRPFLGVCYALSRSIRLGAQIAESSERCSGLVDGDVNVAVTDGD